MSRQQRKSRKNKGKEEGAPQWMVTYSDMVTLLLAFFVLLFSFSSIEKEKFVQAMTSIRAALGMTNRSMVMVPPTQRRLLPIQRKFEKSMEEVVREIQELPDIQDNISFQKTDQGIRIRISNPILFDVGKAQLKGNIYPMLDKIATVLKSNVFDIVVEGHTDNVPIDNEEFHSNWELSAARAVSVVEYFISSGINPRRCKAVAYGEYQPLAENNTVEGRRKNRRVEVFIPDKHWLGDGSLNTRTAG